jgi:uncharacterized protein (TIGR03435 family)
MHRARLTFSLILALPALAIAQTTPAFDAADVHPSPPRTEQSGGFLPNGRIEFRGATLLRLITLAWNIPRNRVVDPPPWLDTDRFDVIAQAPASASQSQMRLMLRALLAERFHLAVRDTERAVPVYALEPEAGHKLPAPGSGKPGCADGEDDTFYIWTCHNTTIAALASALPGAAPQYFDQPVVDRSGLSGTFDFRLEWTNRNDPQSRSIYSSIAKQLGLKVVKATELMQVFAIAKIDRTPAPNPPDTAALLGPLPTEFEVADIQPSPAAEKQYGRFRNGRFEYRAITLRQLIFLATNMHQDWILGGEKWLDTDRYNVLAESAPTSFETMHGMVGALLRDRFHFAYHLEQQPVSVYALEASKPELKPADPSELSTCNPSAGEGTTILTCQNITMAQFAERLAVQPGIEYPVVDQTGLTGSWDFSLAWSPRAQQTSRRRRDSDLAGGAVPKASDPLPGLTILDALSRQLGLRIRDVRHPMTVLVIDHLDRTPTGN